MPIICSQAFDVITLFNVVFYVSVVVLLPLLGYWLMVIDVRAYMRAIKGVLVKVRSRFYDDEGHELVPDWVLRDTPPCISALGLSWPCTEAQIKDAYRKLAEKNHPDLGGDRKKFLKLQTHFEQSIRLVQQPK
ncbi:DnaJ domain-containing protein [Planctomycetota bacterium]